MKRPEGMSFEDYKSIRKNENQRTKAFVKGGTLIWNSKTQGTKTKTNKEKK